MTVGTGDSLVQQAASALGIPAGVVAAQINEESGGDTTALSPTGAMGEFQFEPSTYTGLGFPAGTEDNPTEEVKAYITYMGQLLKQFGGNIQDALAAYNAGPGNIAAGMGYANTILGNAGVTPSADSTGGTGSSSGTASSAPATLLAAGTSGNPMLDGLEFLGNFANMVPDLAGVVTVFKDGANAVGAVNHEMAYILDTGLNMFKPGQAWRLVFTAATVGIGAGAVVTFRSGGRGGGDHLPQAILLTGAALLAGFMAFRPWPVADGKPEKPGAYAYQILEGQAPAAGPAGVSPAEVQTTEFALGTFEAIWALSKVSGSLKNITESIYDAKQAALGWWGDLF